MGAAQLKLTQANSTTSYRVYAQTITVSNIDFDPDNHDNLGFLLRLGMPQQLNVLLCSSGYELTGLCVAKGFRKLLGARV